MNSKYAEQLAQFKPFIRLPRFFGEVRDTLYKKQ